MEMIFMLRQIATKRKAKTLFWTPGSVRYLWIFLKLAVETVKITEQWQFFNQNSQTTHWHTTWSVKIMKRSFWVTRNPPKKAENAIKYLIKTIVGYPTTCSVLFINKNWKSCLQFLSLSKKQAELFRIGLFSCSQGNDELTKDSLPSLLKKK